MNRRETGSVYETKAEKLLESYGYQILEKNYRCKQGEIDLIALDDEYLVFVEVKYRSTIRKGYGEEAVDSRKQRRIIQGARWYLTEHRYKEQKCRFDVVSFLGEMPSLFKDAFQIQ